MAEPEACPGCGHTPDQHEQGTGCLAGWTYDKDGVALLPDGCPCRWAHADSPTRERNR